MLKKFLTWGCGFILLGCSNQYRVDCPDGEPVFILRDINKAYPVYAVEYDASLTATYKALEEMEASATGDLKTEIQRLRENLDQESSRLEMRLKTVVMAMQTTPCDKEARREFRTMIARINEQAAELESQRVNLAKVKDAPDIQKMAVLRGFKTQYRMFHLRESPLD